MRIDKLSCAALALFLGACAPMNQGAGRGTGYMMPFGAPSMFILVVVIGVIFVLLIRGTANRKEPRSPLDILKERYARGEIDHDEFEKIKKRLEE